MFDLQKALASWRSSLEHNRNFVHEDLDELELHLRDQVKALTESGLSEEEAFNKAMQDLGSFGSVEQEYGKVYWGKLKRSKSISSEITWRLTMLKNYWKTATRGLWKNKGITLINVSGLALGMACCIVVALFVIDETSYDTYHQDADRLYRLSTRSVEISSGDIQEGATSSILWGPALERDYPEVVSYARFVKLANSDNPWQLTFEDRQFFEEDILYADSTTFQLFNWPLLLGDVSTALSDPRSIVLTESMAQKYFGDDNPIGKTLTIDPRLRNQDGTPTGATFEFTVSGVLKDIPRRSHFTFDFLLPSAGLNTIYGGDINTGTGLNSWFWRGRVAHTYLQLNEEVAPEMLESKFEDFLARYIGDDTRSRGYYYEPYLQRIDQIYLEGNLQSQLAGVGDLTNIYMFSIVALFILAIACINFTNLSTARSSSRAKEVGLRKVVGAHRKQLIFQFLSESVLISLISFVGALLLAWIIAPIFYGYLNKTFSLELISDSPLLLSLLLLGLLVGLFAGSYPAFFLSRFRPARVLKGAKLIGLGGSTLRKGLIVTQFAISTFLIIATLTVFKQLNFMRSHNLGFDQENVVVVPPSTARPLAASYDAIREELKNNPGIADVTMSSGVPGQGGGGDLYVAKGASEEQSFGLGEVFADYNFIDMFGIEIVAGRDFSKEFGTDEGLQDENGRFTEVTAILNEEAVRRFGWNSPEEALGKQIIRDPNAGDWTANVIGVARDFHFQDLSQPIAPGALILLPSYSYLAVKIQPGNVSESLAFIEDTVSRFSTESAFAYTFLDEAFRDQYEGEQRLGEVFSYLSFLAIFIACLGLLGLASFTTEQRIKEIGIRKALGASVLDISYLLSKGVVYLVLLAIVVALPVAYFATERWLELFAYRIGFSPTTFALSCLLALAVALLTISYQTIKAAKLNPIDNLRYE